MDTPKSRRQIITGEFGVLPSMAGTCPDTFYNVLLSLDNTEMKSVADSHMLIGALVKELTANPEFWRQKIAVKRGIISQIPEIGMEWRILYNILEDNSYDDALVLLCQLDRPQALQLVLNKTNQVDADIQDRMVRAAVSTDSVGVLVLLHKIGFCVDDSYYLVQACDVNAPRCAMYLITQVGVETNVTDDQNRNPLELAIANDMREVFAQLDSRAVAETRTMCAFALAGESPKPYYIQELLGPEEVDLDDLGQAALYKALETCNYDNAQIILLTGKVHPTQDLIDLANEAQVDPEMIELLKEHRQ